MVAPRNQLGGFGGGNNVTRGRKTGAFSVMGDYPEIRRIQSLKLETGRFLNPLDLEESRKVAVIGTRVREVLFAARRGADRRVDRHPRASTSRSSASSPRRSRATTAERDAQTIFVPFTTFQRAFNYGDRVGWMAIISRADVPASVAEEKVLALLRSRHKVAPDDLRAFGHFNLEEEYTKIQGLFTGIRDPRLARRGRDARRRASSASRTSC